MSNQNNALTLFPQTLPKYFEFCENLAVILKEKSNGQIRRKPSWLGACIAEALPDTQEDFNVNTLYDALKKASGDHVEKVGCIETPKKELSKELQIIEKLFIKTDGDIPSMYEENKYLALPIFEEALEQYLVNHLGSLYYVVAVPYNVAGVDLFEYKVLERTTEHDLLGLDGDTEVGTFDEFPEAIFEAWDLHLAKKREDEVIGEGATKSLSMQLLNKLQEDSASDHAHFRNAEFNRVHDILLNADRLIVNGEIYDDWFVPSDYEDGERVYYIIGNHHIEDSIMRKTAKVCEDGTIEIEWKTPAGGRLLKILAMKNENILERKLPDLPKMVVTTDEAFQALNQIIYVNYAFPLITGLYKQIADASYEDIVSPITDFEPLDNVVKDTYSDLAMELISECRNQNTALISAVYRFAAMPEYADLINQMHENYQSESNKPLTGWFLEAACRAIAHTAEQQVVEFLNNRIGQELMDENTEILVIARILSGMDFLQDLTAYVCKNERELMIDI